MSTPKPDFSDRWIQHQREKAKTTPSWVCIFCTDRKLFATEDGLWEHAKQDHVQELEARNEGIESFRREYANKSALKRSIKDNRKPKLGDDNQPVRGLPQQSKRALEPLGRPQPTEASLALRFPTHIYSKTREYRRKALRCSVGGLLCYARPDSASDRDVITEAFAEEHGIPVQCGDNDRSLFKLGTGKVIRSVGRALVPLNVFGNGQSTEHRWFDVLAKCPVSLILGLNFIRKFMLFTQNKHLLVDGPDSFGDLPSLKWIGSPRERINFIADRKELVAGADTGSDLDFMSLRCAREQGFKIDTSESARTRVMLADESVVETVGKVHVSSIQLSNFAPFEMSFDVLPGLPCDVIFGEEFLDQIDAFNTCDIVHLDGNVIQSLNTLINLGPIQRFLTFRRASKPERTPQQEHEELIEAEIYRRSKANRALARIKDETRAATASAIEETMRRDFDDRHASCLHCIGAVTARNDRHIRSSGFDSTVRNSDQVV